MKINHNFLFACLASLAVLGLAAPAWAATPSGTNWFQLLASPYTGADNTGDGGTGNAGDLNYFYVGQAFNTTIQISSDHTNASNIWIDYSTPVSTASNLTTGTYFPSWSGQNITGGRVYSTGYRTSGNSTGAGNFGSVRWTMLRPTAANYGTGAPTTLDINVGTIGLTTESNISYLGSDILQDAEDFRMHVWADTKKPYALNPGPADTSLNVAVETNYTFDLRDSKNGEGDNSGVGTGVNTATPPGAITANGTDMTSYDGYSCSGVWGTNLCNTTVNPTSPLGIPGDQRNWNYSTLYTVNVSGYRDLASAAQNQLGDTNGPNTMDAKTWTFTTEADTVAPQVVSTNPGRNATGIAVSTNISATVHDKKAYPSSISGTGVDSATCRFDVWSASQATTTYQQGLGTVTVTAVDYGYDYSINPAADFAQNEYVYVLARNCQDLVGNVMVPDQWRFRTADTDPPYVDNLTPDNDQSIATAGTVSFHVKDDGVGVDLANTVVYVNGKYYTQAAGGAGFVTVNGTRITYASTTAFTSLAGGLNDYTVTIDPAGDFVAGEAVPVIIYARDFSNNIMERYVYAMAVDGGVSQTCGNSALEGNEVCDDGNVAAGDGCSANCLSNESCGNSLRELMEQCDDGNLVAGDGCDATCKYESSSPSGSSYCGTGTSWSGAACVASCSSNTTGGVSGGGGAPSVAPIMSVNMNTVAVIQIDETSVLVSWLTNIPADSRVVFDTRSVSSLGSAPDYGYARSTPVFEEQALYHSVVVSGLNPQTLYSFRPVSRGNGHEVLGPEIRFAPMFKTSSSVNDLQCPVMNGPATEVAQPIMSAPETPAASQKPKPANKAITTPATKSTTTQQSETRPTVNPLLILEIFKKDNSVLIRGKAQPNTTLKIEIF